ncbi:MAG TPA: DUF6297 family protein [Trebonia sp.]
MTPAATAVPATARFATVRAFTRSRLRGRWLDWYATCFGIGVALIYLGNFLAGPFHRLTAGTRALPVSQSGTGLALIIAAAAGLVLLAQALGPLTLAPADASWLLMSPLNRRAVLRRPAVVAAVLAALAGALLGALALAMAGPYIRQVTHATLGTWLALMALTGAGVAVTAVLLLLILQPYPERARPAVRLPILAVSLIALLAALAGQHWTALPRAIAGHLADVSASGVRPIAIAAVAAALLAIAATWRRLRDFPAAVLWEDSARADRTRLAATFLNFQMLAWIAEDGYWRRRSLRSRPWPRLSPAFLLAWADWRRLGRRPGTLITLAAGTVAPAVGAGAITGTTRGAIVAVALLLGGIAAASQGCGALRRDTGDRTLRRLLGVGTRQALIARAVLPALLSSAWLALALALLVAAGVLHGWGWPVLGVLGGPGLVPAALRTARTAPVDTAAQGGIDTGMGATPPWLVNRVMSILLGGIGTIALLATVISAVRGLALGHPAHSPPAGSFILQLLLSAFLLASYLLAAASRGT